jgi:hypothetical protein
VQFLRCAECAFQFEVDTSNGQVDFACPDCGASVRYPPRRRFPAASSGGDSETSERIYSDVEARMHERSRRLWSAALVFGVLATIVMTGIIAVLLALPRPGAGQIAQGPETQPKATTARRSKTPGPTRPADGGASGVPDRRDHVWPPFPGPTEVEEPVTIPPMGKRVDPPDRSAPEEKPPDRSATQSESPSQETKPLTSQQVRDWQQLLSARLAAKPPVEEEITKVAEELAASGLEGREAACRELCRAQLRGTAGSEALSALVKINEPLCTCVKDVLRDDSRDVQMAAVKRLGTLPAESVPIAALDVLVHFKNQLRTGRKAAGKPEYADDACPGDVIDAMWSVTVDQKKYRDELRAPLAACLRTDINTYALTAAVRYVTDTTKSADEAANLLVDCFNRLRGQRPLGKGKEDLLKRVDGVRLAVVQALSRNDLAKNSRVHAFLKGVSNSDPSKEVRDEAAQVLKQQSSTK